MKSNTRSASRNRASSSRAFFLMPVSTASILLAWATGISPTSK